MGLFSRAEVNELEEWVVEVSARQGEAGFLVTEPKIPQNMHTGLRCLLEAH